MHIYIYTYKYVCFYIYSYTCIYTYIYIYTYVNMPVDNIKYDYTSIHLYLMHIQSYTNIRVVLKCVYGHASS